MKFNITLLIRQLSIFCLAFLVPTSYADKFVTLCISGGLVCNRQSMLACYILFYLIAILLLLLFFNKRRAIARHFKFYYKNYLLLCGATICSLLFAEAALRIRARIVDRLPRVIHHYEVDFRYWKNSLGFRDDEFKKTKPKDTFRIFLIGDSIVAGVVVDQNYTLDTLLEKKCVRNGLHCEVFNLGVDGTGPSSYFQVAKQFKDYNPDLVIVSVCVDNDIEHLPRYKKEFSFGEFLKRIPIIRHSELWKWLNEFLRTKKELSLLKRYPINEFYRKLIYEGKISIWLPRRAMVLNNQRYYDSLVELFYEESPFRYYLLAIKKFYAHTPYLVLFNPSNYQVNVSYFEPMRKMGFKIEDKEIVDRKLQDAMISEADKNNIEYVDLLPYMLAAPQNGAFYYKLDGHYTAQGNKFVVDILFQQLKEKNLLPEHLYHGGPGTLGNR